MGVCCSSLSGDVAGGKQGVGGAPQRSTANQNNHGHNDAADLFSRSLGLQPLFTQIEGPKPEAKPAATPGAGTDAKPSSSAPTTGAQTEKVSTDKNRNYAVLAVTETAPGARGWYLKSSGKKAEEVQDSE